MPYRERESVDAVNTAIAAAASEQVIAGTKNVPNFNNILVVNSDTMEDEVQLDNSAAPGRVFKVPAGVIMEISPEEGIRFTTVLHVNNGAGAQTAGAIRYRAANKERVL